MNAHIRDRVSLIDQEKWSRRSSLRRPDIITLKKMTDTEKQFVQLGSLKRSKRTLSKDVVVEAEEKGKLGHLPHEVHIANASVDDDEASPTWDARGSTHAECPVHFHLLGANESADDATERRQHTAVTAHLQSSSEPSGHRSVSSECLLGWTPEWSLPYDLVQNVSVKRQKHRKILIMPTPYCTYQQPGALDADHRTVLILTLQNVRSVVPSELTLLNRTAGLCDSREKFNSCWVNDGFLWTAMASLQFSAS